MYKTVARLKKSPAMTIPSRLNFDVRCLVARHASLWPFYQPYIWWDKRKKASRGIPGIQERVVGPHTEIVIDGFQGSANSYATAAFRNSQVRKVGLAHHMHSPVQIIQGIERGLPVVVTIREPQRAVLSLASRWSYVTVTQGIRNYTRFYGSLVPHLDDIVVSTFERTTKHFDEVIAEANKRFGTDFALFENTEENRAAIRRPEKFETDDWKRRQEIKKVKQSHLESPKAIELLADADKVYQAFAEAERQHAQRRVH